MFSKKKIYTIYEFFNKYTYIPVYTLLHYYMCLYTYKSVRSSYIILFIRLTNTFYNGVHFVHECCNRLVRVVLVVFVCVCRTFSLNLKQFYNLQLFYILQTISVKLYRIFNFLKIYCA